MDLKQKLRGMLSMSKDGDEEPPEVLWQSSDLGLTEVEVRLLSRDPERTIREIPLDPLADQETLDTIEAAYVDSGCDGGRYQLQKLPSQTDLEVIRFQRQALTNQLGAVSRRMFSVILQKRVECADELRRVLELQDELDTALGVCGSGRLQLDRARQHLTAASLGLLAHHRRRRHLVEIARSLKSILTLERMGRRVQELLCEESYAEAIALLIEGRKAAETYRKFTCVAQLSSRLKDTLEMAEEQLDAGVARTCRSFDEQLYCKLQLAFGLLGKRHAALDQLNLHLASRLHSTTFVLVTNFVQLSRSANQGTTGGSVGAGADYSKMQFGELCGHVAPSLFIACLRDLCTCMWSVTFTYHQILKWHETLHQQQSVVVVNQEITEDQEQLWQKLQHGSVRLWQDVQNKTRTFLLSASDLGHFSIDDFLHVLDLVDRLVDIGRQFCSSSSEILQDAVRQQSIHYFRTFHRGRLDELRVFLENESWEHCPVRSNFTVLQLAEFRFLNSVPVPTDASNDASTDDFYSSDAQSPFARCGFEAIGDENIMVRSRGGGVAGDDGSDEDDAGDVRLAPLLANTTLSVLRLFGRYIHFMRLLKTIAFDVLICLNQLFDFYLYSVYAFFGTYPVAACDGVLTDKLRDVIRRIGDMLIVEGTGGAHLLAAATTYHQADCKPVDLSTVGVQHEKVACPQISRQLQLDSRANMYGLEMRLVAAESVVFVARQMELLRPILMQLLPPAKEAALQQFFAQTLAVAQDLRLPVYASVSSRCLDSEQIVALMSRVQWDIKEVMSQHSHYVDVLIEALKAFGDGVQRIGHGKAMPAEVYNILWEHMVRLSYSTLLDGLAMARKCTNEGRALMQLDLRQLQLKVEHLTRLRPLPESALVETYIKAFYLPESTLEQWVQQHPEYSTRHLMSLLQCVGQANKKNRLSLAALMEELDLSRR